MKEKSTLLILICFVLVSLNNGHLVKRSDFASVHPLNDMTDLIVNENAEEYDDHNNHESSPNHEETNENLNENFQHVLNEDDADDEEELHLELQQSVTDTVTDDVGLEGSLETNFPDELCDGSKMFLPNTKNCSLFYDCNNKEGSACPHGMWFDPNYIGDTFCQFPEVICAADNDICDCAEQYPPPPPDPLIEKSVSCLKGNKFHLIPSQVNCGRYFICHNEMKYRMECRQGLHYNAKTEMCDYPEVVNCRIPDPDCPSEGISFLPDSTRCEVFYFCVHGFKTKQVCPFYHIWDIRSNSCRRQDEAFCHLDE